MKRIQLFWKSAFFGVLIYLIATPLFAAVGCDLNDPDRDVKRLFPESTGYKTLYVSIAQKGGEALLREVEARLGDHFQGLYETVDVPYTMYQVFSGKELIGYIHGVNQKGQYGGIQVFLALDLEGTIRAFYFQKLTSQYAKSLRDIRFGEQFVGLSLKDFYEYDVVNHQAAGDGRVARIQNPAPEAESDFRAALRAAKKNLILVDEFLLGNRHLEYFQSKDMSYLSDKIMKNGWHGASSRPPAAKMKRRHLLENSCIILIPHYPPWAIKGEEGQCLRRCRWAGLGRGRTGTHRDRTHSSKLHICDNGE
jgi:hypothetical protein